MMGFLRKSSNLMSMKILYHRSPVGQDLGHPEQIFKQEIYFFLTMMRSGVPVNW